MLIYVSGWEARSSGLLTVASRLSVVWNIAINVTENPDRSMVSDYTGYGSPVKWYLFLKTAGWQRFH